MSPMKKQYPKKKGEGEQMREILQEAISEIWSATLEQKPRLFRLPLISAIQAAIRAANRLLPPYLDGSICLAPTSQKIVEDTASDETLVICAHIPCMI
ncbi:unnamed protein product [Euphydryas editha]|uniref:Uncharacterized protein n=1 Tax=Euphydryas editha TaxID=104508 RepID=A0AAU9UJE4_EUPED|nr:unnamed protein product [Euphydryas editha]